MQHTVHIRGYETANRNLILVQQHPFTLHLPKHSVQIEIMTRLCISCCTCCEESNNKLVFHKTFDCFIPRFYSTKIMSVSARHFVCEISGSHTSAAEDSSLLGCYGVSLCSHQHFEGTTILQNAGS